MDQIIINGRIMWEPDSKVGFWLPPMPVYSESEVAPLIEQGFQPIAQDQARILSIASQLLPLIQVTKSEDSAAEIWAALDVAEIAPVTLACNVAGQHPEAGSTASPDSLFVTTPDLRPPMTLGAFGIILNKADTHPTRFTYELAALPPRQQHLYERCQEDLRTLAMIEPEAAGWAERWQHLHQCYLKLAKAYFRLHQTRSTTNAPPVVNIYTGGEGWGPITLPVYGVVAAIQNAASGGRQWENGERPSYTHKFAGTQTTVFLQRPKPANRTPLSSQPPGAEHKALAAAAVTVLSDTTVKSLWEQVGKMRDLDADLVLMLLAQHATAPHLPDETVWMTVEMAMWIRGIRPKTHKDAGGHRFAGYLEEEKQPYREGLERLDLMWISISQRLRGKKLLTLESKLFDFRERWTQQPLFEGTEAQVGAVRFMPGTWLDELLTRGEAGKQFGRYLQKVFQYDLRKPWQKRLARYFTFHLRIAGRLGSHTIQRTVGELLKECSLIENEEYARRYPERIRDQFERAMIQLSEDELINDWQYVDLPERLPGHNWFEVWRNAQVAVSIAPLLIDPDPPLAMLSGATSLADTNTAVALLAKDAASQTRTRRPRRKAQPKQSSEITKQTSSKNSSF